MNDPHPPAADDHPPTSIFVYGTLKRRGSRQSQWPHSANHIVPARIRGSLFDLGPYPALLLDDRDWVGGERWEIASKDLRETLQVLDQIEGYHNQPNDLYRRCQVKCYDQDGTTHLAYAYEFARSGQLLAARRIPANGEGLCVWPFDRRRLGTDR